MTTRGERNAHIPATVPWLTVGTVIDTNDPQQMGRLRVLCPTLGETEDTNLVDIPWAMYVSPFGGSTSCGQRGPEYGTSQGPISYGMWAIPKVGAQAVVMCLDGNPSYRVWLGCIYGQFLPHTLPMGRWLFDEAIGPWTSSENFIQPAFQNASEAFSNANASPEWKTRIAEKQAAGIRAQALDRTTSSQPDERANEEQRQGYQRNRIRPDLKHPRDDLTVDNLDSQVYSFTTPGMHTILMDDSERNGKIRIRTTSGNQIILDDTNERIYISTPEGKNYIEMDRKGNIDIYTSRRLSVHAEKDINFTTEGSFRVSAKDIHLRTSEDVRVHAGGDFQFLTEGETLLTSGGNLNLFSNGDLRLSSVENLDCVTGGRFHVLGNDLFALDTAATIHFNSGLANPNEADSIGDGGSGKYAYTTNRVPIHEPWGRISNNPNLTDRDGFVNPVSLVFNMTTDSGVLELKYTSENANKVDLGDNLGRNDKWRR